MDDATLEAFAAAPPIALAYNEEGQPFGAKDIATSRWNREGDNPQSHIVLFSTVEKARVFAGWAKGFDGCRPVRASEFRPWKELLGEILQSGVLYAAFNPGPEGLTFSCSIRAYLAALESDAD